MYNVHKWIDRQIDVIWKDRYRKDRQIDGKMDRKIDTRIYS